MGEFKVGDRVRISDCNAHDASHNGLVGEITRIDNSGVPYYINTDEMGNVWADTVEEVELIESEKQSLAPFKKLKMTNKKVIKVLAVDKKTSKVLKNISVVAENEQTAILKAFGVDVEKVYIKTTEEGDFEEEKPVKVILDKAKEDKPKK